EVLDHRDAALLEDRVLERLAAPRDDDVDAVVAFEQPARHLASALDQLHGCAGQPGGLDLGANRRRDRAVRRLRLGAALQDRGAAAPRRRAARRPWPPWTRRRARARRRARHPRARPPCARPRSPASPRYSNGGGGMAPPPAPRPGRASALGGRRSEQHEVVAVDDLVAALVAEQALDVARVRALDLLELGRAVVDEAAGELAPVGTEAAHAVPHPEAAGDRAYAR